MTTATQDDKVTISVHNFAPPIPVTKQAELFDPMVRGGNLDNSVRSVGLGLFIVRAIAQAHHGPVAVSSQLHLGTEFVFQFLRQ